MDFSRNRPNCDPHHHVKPDVNPDHVLYIGRDGACVRVSKERLIVEGIDLLPHVSIPRRAVNRIVLTGSVGLSAGARSWALYNASTCSAFPGAAHIWASLPGRVRRRTPSVF